MGKTTYNRGKRAHAVCPNVEEEAMVYFNPLSLFLLLALLSGCAAPEPSATPTTFTPVPTITPTPTETATLVPKLAWQQTIESQDSQDKFFQIIDGKPVINLYDTQATESIILNQETIKITATTDGLNPNILTAQDADSNQYAFNPDFGWFKVPEVQMNYADLTKYTEVDQSFIEDGRANITAALKYAENPTISSDAVDPIYWVTYNPYTQVFSLCLNGCGMEYIYYQKHPDDQKSHVNSYYNSENKPYTLEGFYKVHLNNGGAIYVVGRTLKNPTETKKNRTINLFYGFDQAYYEKMANNMLPSGRTELKMVIDGVNEGGYDLETILPPPEQITNESGQITYPPYHPATVKYMSGPNPIVGSLQERGKIISFFSQINQKIILAVLLDGQQEQSISPLPEPIPNQLSKYILQTTLATQ